MMHELCFVADEGATTLSVAISQHNAALVCVSEAREVHSVNSMGNTEVEEVIDSLLTICTTCTVTRDIVAHLQLDSEARDMVVAEPRAESGIELTQMLHTLGIHGVWVSNNEYAEFGHVIGVEKSRPPSTIMGAPPVVSASGNARLPAVCASQ
jgi:hypothetical protein